MRGKRGKLSSFSGKGESFQQRQRRVEQAHLTIPEQGREVEEEGLAQGHRLDRVVKVVAFVKLHLESRDKAGSASKTPT